MIYLILFAIFCFSPDCTPIQKLGLCSESRTQPCIRASGFTLSLQIKDQSFSLGTFENFRPKSAFIWPGSNGKTLLVLGLDSGDRLNTVLPRFFEFSDEDGLDELPFLVEDFQSLPEGSVLGEECDFDNEAVGCIILSKAIIHYNSAPPFLMQTMTLAQNPDQGIKDLQIKLDPVHPKTAWQHLNLAKELLENQDYETSERHYREGLYLLSKDPIMYPDGTHARLRYDFGFSLLKLKKITEAKTVLESVLLDFPNTSASEDLKDLIDSDPDAKNILKEQRKQ